MIIRSRSPRDGKCREKFVFGAIALLLILLCKQHYEVAQKHRDEQELLSDNNPGTNKTSRQQSRMSSTHRVADSQSCQPPRTKTINLSNVPEPMKPKVSHKSAVELALGGCKNIAKGSGSIQQVGPLVLMLSKLQLTKLSLSGSVGEVGVHHGRFTSFLFLTARDHEDLVAGDLFEDMQELNVDQSGFGNKQSFLKGAQTCGLKEKDLHTLCTGSTDELPFDWAQQAVFEPFRLFSVDAGHTAALTHNDLQVAFCNSQPGAIVILDDFFHGGWPGVTEGFFQFLLNGPEPLAGASFHPVLSCEGKLFIANDQDAHDLCCEEPSKSEDLVSPHAHEKSRGKTMFEMKGANHLRCKNKSDTDKIHELWASLVF